MHQEAAQVHGGDLVETDLPFPGRLVPHRLTASGGWRDRTGGAPGQAQATQR